MRLIGLSLVVSLLASMVSSAHYNMLLPDKPSAEKGEKVTFTYQFGHPFEHELLDAPKPVALALLTPKGEREVLNIDKVLTKIERPGADKKKVTCWQFEYTPPTRGDYSFMLRTAKFKLEEQGGEAEDYVRVTLHVQTQNGWNSYKPVLDTGRDIRPYTRPYGILPGMVFHGRALEWRTTTVNKKEDVVSLPIAEYPIEIEKYNDRPVKALPPDELITFKTTTDVNGCFVASLPESGWWGITSTTWQGGPGNTKSITRATLWVHVDEKK